VSINRTIIAIGVAKSTVYYKSKGYPDRKRTLRKHLPDDVKADILKITEMKATYGTPRVKAILKRDYSKTISKYMVHRFMKEEGLLITRNRTRGSSRPHTGKIAVDKPNTRWASDITSINVGMDKNLGSLSFWTVVIGLSLHGERDYICKPVT